MSPVTPQSQNAGKKSLSPERMARFREYAEEYPNLRSALMMTLRLAEEEFGSVTDEAMALVADLCQVSVAHVQGMVTFYTHFKRPFHGKHRFMVCATLMCALENNTKQALTQIQEKLGIGPGQRTADGLFSCEKVECLADCDKPPVVQCDNDHFCAMKGKQLDEYLDKLLKAEGKTAADYQGRPAVAIDVRVPVLPVHFNFPGEKDVGSRHFEDKDAYLQPGEGARNTQVPPALKTPFTAPVVDGVDGSKHSNGANGSHGRKHG